GLSMGGYGAMKLAFNKPETFAAAGCFSRWYAPGSLWMQLPL
ncbi:MAG: esterase family protein, partial [Lentisphaeria bacterium]|nr:esterase family protein [Lentisphaeria bacterium]